MVNKYYTEKLKIERHEKTGLISGALEWSGVTLITLVNKERTGL